MRSIKFIQNYHNEHTKFNFGMLIVVILYEFHTSHFAVYVASYIAIGIVLQLIVELCIFSYLYVTSRLAIDPYSHSFCYSVQKVAK